MIQGTTPTHIFTIPIDVEQVKKLEVSYAQNGVVIVKKDLTDCSVNGHTYTVKLSQEETLKFVANTNVQIQIRVLTVSDDALASKIKTRTVLEILDKAVL